MTTPVLDHEALMSLKELLGENFDLLLETYVTDGNARLAALVEAFKLGDMNVVREQAHGLKGSSNNLGIAALGAICNEVEQQAKNCQSDGLEQKISSLQQMFAAACDEIESLRQ